MKQIWEVKDQKDYDEMLCHFHDKVVDEKALLQFEKINTIRTFNFIYGNEPMYWRKYSFRINPNYELYHCRSLNKITNSRNGINVIYPTVISTFFLEIHTKFVGKTSAFLYSLYKLYGYDPFTFEEVTEILAREYIQIEKENIDKMIKFCFRHFMCDQILLISEENSQYITNKEMK